MTIWAAILRGARALGRWWILELLARGREMLLGYMRGKLRDFARRLPRLKKPWRRRWLRGRIRRWRAVVRLLETRQREINSAAIRAYCQATDSALARLPLVAAGERCPRS